MNDYGFYGITGLYDAIGLLPVSLTYNLPPCGAFYYSWHES